MSDATAVVERLDNVNIGDDNLVWSWHEFAILWGGGVQAEDWLLAIDLWEEAGPSFGRDWSWIRNTALAHAAARRSEQHGSARPDIFGAPDTGEVPPSE